LGSRGAWFISDPGFPHAPLPLAPPTRRGFSQGRAAISEAKVRKFRGASTTINKLRVRKSQKKSKSKAKLLKMMKREKSRARKKQTKQSVGRERSKNRLKRELMKPSEADQLNFKEIN